MQPNGIAHIQLSVVNIEACTDFYEKLCTFFEMKEVPYLEGVRYWIGAKTGLAIKKALSDEKFDQGKAGLHHL